MLAVAVAVALLPSLLHAQLEDDGRLYNPPHLEMAGMLSGSFYLSSSAPAAGAPIVIEQSQRLWFEPFLPAVFFDGAGSTRPAPRYLFLPDPSSAASYSDTIPLIEPAAGSFVDGYLDDALTLHPTRRYEVLDVIGVRLRRFPDASLDIEGGYEGNEDPSVGVRRAELMRDHLLSVWGIAPGRLRLLPPQLLAPSNALESELAEARRVVFYSNQPRLFDPLVYHRLSVHTPFLHLFLTLNPRFAAEDIGSIELSVAVGDALVYRDQIVPARDSLRYRLYGIVPVCAALDHSGEQVTAQAVVTLRDGRRFGSNPARLPFDLHTPGLVWVDSAMRVYNDDGVFLLPFYGMNQSAIAPHQERVLREVRDSIRAILTAPRNNQLWLARRAEDSARYHDQVVQAMSEKEGGSDGERTVDGSTGEGAPPPDTAQRDPFFAVLDPPSIPRVRIVSCAEATELMRDSLLAEYRFSSREHEVWNRFYRALRGEMVAALMSQVLPPRMAVIREMEEDGEGDRVAANGDAMMSDWLGFDLNERLAQISTELSTLLNRERHDTAWYTNSYRASPVVLERARTLIRARVAAVRERLVQLLGSDSDRVHIVCDTDNVEIDNLHSRSSLAYPENSMLERRTRVELTIQSAPYPERDESTTEPVIDEQGAQRDSLVGPSSTALPDIPQPLDSVRSDSAMSHSVPHHRMFQSRVSRRSYIPAPEDCGARRMLSVDAERPSHSSAVPARSCSRVAASTSSIDSIIAPGWCSPSGKG